MAKEIEHKYLTVSNEYRLLATSSHIICQGYLSLDKERTVRVRTIDNRGFVTIKGKNKGALRQEFEYEIPVADAKDMLETLCLKPVIDEFKGALSGLVLAEIELPDVNHKYSIPKFIGKNVTGDPRYYNSVLSTATSLPE